MASPSTRPTPRFHRRILGIGALLAVLLLVIGAPFFANRIEDDLEARVPIELADAGFAGISATFSGQDGTLRCSAPLDDPEEALSAAYDVWGVRAIELDRSCRVNRAPTVETTTTITVDDSADDSTATDAQDDVTDDTTADTPEEAPETTLPPDFDTVADIVSSSPQLSLLSVLIQESGLGDIVGPAAEQEVTLFAPTDEAFDALPADSLAELRADPELLRRLLSHHAAQGAISANDLVAGTLATLDGGSVEVATPGSSIVVAGAEIVTADIVAANGVVHIIDEVLVPADIDLSMPDPVAETSARYDSGGFRLTGVVASEVERAVLIAAATSASGSPDVDDQLTVDPDTGLDADTTTALAQLVAAVPDTLLNGVAGFDGENLFVTGTYLTEADRDEMVALAESVGATVELEPQPEATETDAVDLEVDLNAFVALDRLALEALQFAGVAITVEGHTDSDGDPDENRVLSQFRALVVRQALIERGIPEASITAIGFGSDQPVLVN